MKGYLQIVTKISCFVQSFGKIIFKGTSMSHSPTPTLLGDLLSAAALAAPDREAVVFHGERQTWAAFNEQVDQLAASLLALGVQRRHRIGVLSTTRPEYLCVYLAAARIGAVLVGFNIQFTPAEITRLADITRPVVMVVLDQLKGVPFAAPLLDLLATFEYVRHVLVIGSEMPAARTVGDLMNTPVTPHARLALQQRAAELQPDDPALIVFTSGSTGTPKGAVLTHRSILTTGRVQARQFALRADDRVLQNKPMNHVGGSINLTIPALVVGAALVLMDHFHPVRALELVREERITVLGQVPTMFIMEFNLPNFADYDLSSVRLAIVGGAATPVPIMHRIMAIADTVMTGFGMTETGGYITFTHPDDPPEVIAATVGRVADEYELRIVDEARHPLPQGEVGEVALRGACLLKEYFDDPAASAESRDGEGWFYTGDVGVIDRRGCLTLVDRRKEMYITGGYNVYPREIELYLAQHPGVAMVAVLGAQDAVMGEVGVAFVTPVPGADVSIDDLRAFCASGLAEYKIPRRFHVIDAFPLTPLGKIDKPRLRKELL